MAQIVLIAEGTLRMDKDGVTPLNRIGDVVGIHDDKTDLSGPGYSSFKIVRVDMTTEEVQIALDKLRPETQRAYKTKSDPDKWAFERPEEAEFWNDEGTWRILEKIPKYTVNLANIDDVDSASLTNVETDGTAKAAILSVKGEHNFYISTANMITMDALNGEE